MTSCPECGALVADMDGATHAYVPSAPGCWAAFGSVQADAVTRFGWPRLHGTVVDCYMAQHPGDGSERRARQSPIVHLVSLCLLIEHGVEGVESFRRMSQLLDTRPDFEALHPRQHPGTMTILDMRGCTDVHDYTNRAERWADDVWQTWAHEQSRIRRLVDDVLSGPDR